MAYIEQKNRLAPTWEQAFKNCIEFRSNLLSLSRLIYLDVDLFTRNVELYMLIHQTHNSEKGANLLRLSHTLTAQKIKYLYTVS